MIPIATPRLCLSCFALRSCLQLHCHRNQGKVGYHLLEEQVFSMTDMESLGVISAWRWQFIFVWCSMSYLQISIAAIASV